MIGNEILALLQNKDEVSLVNDILPMVFDEFSQPNICLCPNILTMMQDYVTQLLYACVTSGVVVVCVPVFVMGTIPGEVVVKDMVYKKICMW